jgi:hypothetical protein
MSGFPPGLDLRNSGTTVALLVALEALFAVRVVGQWLVSRRVSKRLPPMSEWYSGLIPYPRLLAIQVALIVVMAGVTLAVGLGFPIGDSRPAIGSALLLVAWPYGLSMPIRYAVRMWRHPEARWTGRTIPIVFHVVLAGWLFVLGSYLRSTG